MTEDMHFVHGACAVQSPLHYRACGLDNVYLCSGYTREEIAGEMYTSVKDADDLHKAIARHLVLRRKVLSGKEIRFLRKFMGLTQAQLADFLSISDQSVARYEKEQSPLEGSSDRLLRILALGKIVGAIDPAEVIEEIRQSDGSASDNMLLEHDETDWKVAA